MTHWLRRVIWGACVLSVAIILALYDYSTRPRPERAGPAVLYRAVQHHLEACRAQDYPRAYHEAPSTVLTSITLVEFKRQLHNELAPVRFADHIEYGAVRRTRDRPDAATVDVYFVSGTGDADGWVYSLIFEDGDWKIEHGERLPFWQPGERMSGQRL